jgi:flagellar protein FlbD
MIQVTRFNHTEFTVNADLIEFVEHTPDTIITMVTGRKVLVLESVDEIKNRVIKYRREAGPFWMRLDGVEPQSNAV